MKQVLIYLEGIIDEDLSEFEVIKSSDLITVYDVLRIYEQGSFLIVENLEETYRIPFGNIRYVHEKNNPNIKKN